MYTLLAIWAFGVGVIFGSFLNALLFRFNTGKSMGGRSRCMGCNHTLHALDLVPILSYVYLRGKCRYCGARVSLQYPLVEAVAGVLSIKIFFLFYPNLYVWAFWLLVWLFILFIVVYDLRHKIIPWSASLPLILLAFVSVCIPGIPELRVIVAGPLLALPLFLLSLVSNGRWMGWADSVFELSLGTMLGASLGASALLMAVWSGAFIGLLLIVLQRFTPKGQSHKGEGGFTIHSEIPFAPFLALGAAIAFFFHVDFFSTFSQLF